jgi:uncharacterized protein YjbI with pentapeptide repeats
LANLSDGDLEGADDLDGANLDGSLLGGTNFKNANLMNANFQHSHLSSMNPTTNFEGANIEGADFRGISFPGLGSNYLMRAFASAHEWEKARFDDDVRESIQLNCKAHGPCEQSK